MPGSERMFSASSCRWPPARSSTSWLCSSGALIGCPAQESSTAGSCRKSHVGVQSHSRQVRPKRHEPVGFLHAPVADAPARLSGRPSARRAPGSARSNAPLTPGAPPRPARGATPRSRAPGTSSRITPLDVDTKVANAWASCPSQRFRARKSRRLHLGAAGLQGRRQRPDLVHPAVGRRHFLGGGLEDCSRPPGRSHHGSPRRRPRRQGGRKRAGPRWPPRFPRWTGWTHHWR